MSSLNVSVLTFNCGRELVNPPVFAEHLSKTAFTPQPPDLIIVSLQEIAPIAYSFLGGSFLASYFNKLNHAVHLAAKSATEDVVYIPLITRNVGMTALMSFVREDRATRVRVLAVGGVGVGVHEMGNKGAVGLRLGYETGDGTMQLTFVAAHLAPMEWACERRNQDWQDICQGLVFTPVKRDSSQAALPPSRESGDEDGPLLQDKDLDQMSGLYTPTSHIFLAGDLNYRTSRLKPSLTDHATFPQPMSNNTSSRHYAQLLKKDQLLRELKAERACHGFKEAPVDFPPTYKYSNLARATIGREESEKWLWAKHRWPSWCDRVLYLERGDVTIEVTKYTALPLMATSDHRAVTATFSIPLKLIHVSDVENVYEAPFSLDQRWKERRAVARRKEILVGIFAYLGLTWEGRSFVAAVIIGALVGWTIVQRSLDGLQSSSTRRVQEPTAKEVYMKG